MSLVAHVSIALFPLIMLILLYIDNHNNKRAERADKIFDILILTLILILIFSVLTRLHVDTDNNYVAVLMNIVSMIYYVLTAIYSLLWLLYVKYSVVPHAITGKFNISNLCIYSEEILGKKYTSLSILYALPAAMYILMVLTSPYSKLIFYLGSEGNISQGHLHVLSYIVILIYYLYASVCSVIGIKKENNTERRKTLKNIFAFSSFPVAGTLLQMFFGQLDTVWISTSLTLFTIYVTVQNNRISVDSLTGLYNRRELESYIIQKMKRTEDNDSWCLIIADIDNFKLINDNFGHAVGDEALRRVADIYRETFKHSKAFLSRYGGDEFALIEDCKDDKEAQSIIERIYDAANIANDRAASEKYKYSLKLSAGFTMYNNKRNISIKKLLEEADTSMYNVKTQHKLTRHITGGAGD